MKPHRPQTDIHCRTTEHHQLSADRDLAFLHVIGTDITDTTRQHDRLMVTP